MASFSVIGFIDSIKVLDGSCLLVLSEYRKGYTRSDGVKVQDRWLSWSIIFKSYFKRYLFEHFSRGMLVEVKGEVLPYVVERGVEKDGGYSVIGQTCNLFSYPRQSVMHKAEERMIRDSQLGDDGRLPDLDGYNEPDF